MVCDVGFEVFRNSVDVVSGFEIMDKLLKSVSKFEDVFVSGGIDCCG